MQSISERNKKILERLEVFAKDAMISKKSARDTLIKTGIYTKKGRLRVEFGGAGSRKRQGSELA